MDFVQASAESGFSSSMPLDGRLGSIGEQSPLTVTVGNEDTPMRSSFALAASKPLGSEPESPAGAGHPISLKVSFIEASSSPACADHSDEDNPCSVTLPQHPKESQRSPLSTLQ